MQNRVITIGREFGSGGREIGIELAQKLGIPFYDKELITLAAQNGGLNESFLAANEERTPIISASSFGRGDFMASFYQPSFSDKIFFEQSDIIRELAAKGPCVIVGRCADYVLRETDAVNVFIAASMPYKIARKRGMAPEKADYTDSQMEKYIRDMDKHRRKYYEHYTGRTWGLTANYHLCVCSDYVGTHGVVQTILTYLENIK